METINHLARALSLVIAQYKGKENLTAIISAITGECNNLETALHDLFEKRSLAEAEGAQLDGWGKILDVDRLSMSDDDYRARLEIKIAENYSEGTIEDLIGVFYRLSGAESVAMHEYPPSSFEIQAFKPNPLVNAETIINAVSGAKIAGVEFKLSYAYTPIFSFLENPLRWGCLGFDDGSGTQGGYFAAHI